jgi:condensin complex subunit 3
MAPRPNPLDGLQERVASVFEQAQLTMANHRKNCVALYKIHQDSSEVTKEKEKSKGKVKRIGENTFTEAFIQMLNRVLVVKKGPATADRVVKFIGSYIKFMNERSEFSPLNTRFKAAKCGFRSCC